MSGKNIIGNVTEPLILIPEGEYKVQFKTFRTSLYRGNKNCAKLELIFIVQDSAHQGTQLSRYYNVETNGYPSQKNDSFDFGGKSHLYREYVNLFSHSEVVTGIDLNRFQENELIAKIETVKVDHERKLIPKDAWYSVIRRLIRTSDVPF